MKAYLSKNSVRELVLTLDDAYKADDGEDAVWDYIGIMKNLLLANRFRDESNKLELSSDTVDWLFSVLDELMFNPKKQGRKLSAKSRKALDGRMREQRW